MEIEVIEFYPLERSEEKDYLTGTLRIKLPDIGIHLLGIYVSKNKKYWHFDFPGRRGTHHETGEPVRYPFIVFEDKEKQKELISVIRDKGREFIEKKLCDKENPLIFPEKKEKAKPPRKQKEEVMGSKVLDIATESKETISNLNTNVASKEATSNLESNSIAKPIIDEVKRKQAANSMSANANQKLKKEASDSAKANQMAKEAAPKEKLKSMQSIASKQWIDPPKRKDLVHIRKEDEF